MRQKVLLHICCAPDSTAAFERLTRDYEVIGFFHNPNIHPEGEYRRRRQEALNVASRMGFELLVPPYGPDVWLETVKGLEEEPEGGVRCTACYQYNLQATAEKAKKLGIPYFTTTLTISPHKRSQKIFSIGKTLGEEAGIEFLAVNFKRQGGFKRSLEISQEMGLYRQKYCGCRFSRRKIVGEGNARTP